MLNPPKTIKTERLRLRKAKLADAEAIFRQYAQDPEVTRYVSWRAHRNLDETREYVQMCLLAWDVGKAFHWVIESAEDKQVMGMIIARVNAEVARALAAPALRERLNPQAVEVKTSTPEELSVLTRNRLAQMAKLIKDAGIQPD